MRIIRRYVDPPLAAGTRVDPARVRSRPPACACCAWRSATRCVLFNGDGHDYDARLLRSESAGRGSRTAGASRVANESPLRITLVQGIARGEKMDLILQKATELGVACIAPVVTERTEVKLDGERADKTHGALARRAWLRPANSADGRALPQILEPQSLGSLRRWRRQRPPLRAGSRRRADAGRRCAWQPGNSVSLLIGPEGGLSRARPGRRARGAATRA